MAATGSAATGASDAPPGALEFVLLAVLATLWGASYAFIRLGVATIPPATLIAARTVIAGTVLVLVMRGRGRAMPRDGATWRRFLVQALLNSVVPFTLIAWAERSVESGLATILNSTSPIFAFLLTAIATRGGAATKRKLLGVGIGLAGTCLVVGWQALAGLGGDLLAELAIVAATLCYAGAAMVGRSFAGFDPMAPAAGSLLCGAAILIPVSLAVDRPWTLSPSLASVLALFALSLASTALAFVIYFRLVRTLGSVGVTAQSYLRVPVGVAIGVLFLGEELPASAWVGFVCVVLGVAAMTVPPAQGARQFSAATTQR